MNIITIVIIYTHNISVHQYHQSLLAITSILQIRPLGATRKSVPLRDFSREENLDPSKRYRLVEKLLNKNRSSVSWPILRANETNESVAFGALLKVQDLLAKHRESVGVLKLDIKVHQQTPCAELPWIAENSQKMCWGRHGTRSRRHLNQWHPSSHVFPKNATVNQAVNLISLCGQEWSREKSRVLHNVLHKWLPMIGTLTVGFTTSLTSASAQPLPSGPSNIFQSDCGSLSRIQRWPQSPMAPMFVFP